MEEAIEAMDMTALQSVVYEVADGEEWRIVAQKASSIR